MQEASQKGNSTVIAEGLGALKSAFDIGHAINQRVKEGKLFPNEIAEQLLHLQQLILESQRALNDAAEEIRLLKDEIATQKQAEDISKDLEWVPTAVSGYGSRKGPRVYPSAIVRSAGEMAISWCR